jgi:hypothetical protein
MGLLDEAIREHLELKRRRGADPTEVERLEREALGPVRRIQQEPAVDEPVELAGEVDDSGLMTNQAEVQHGFEPGDDLTEQPDYEYTLEDDEFALEEPAPASPAPAGPEVPDTHGVVPPPEPVHAEEHPPEPAPVEDHLPETQVSNRPVYEDPGVETAEYDVEAEHAEDDDVLEETPEFLQDAPEHDRLWFEQRPPKDFDFDG